MYHQDTVKTFLPQYFEMFSVLGGSEVNGPAWDSDGDQKLFDFVCF